MLKVFKQMPSLGLGMKIGNNIKQILKLSFGIMYISHLVACLFFFESKLSGFPPECWVVKENIIDDDPIYQFWVAFYWSLQTVFTVGYGDILPSTEFEKVFSMLWMIAGIGFYSYTIGNLTSMIMDFDKNEVELSEKRAIIYMFGAKNHLS